jgi:tetratricopeptide repeat protein
MKKNIFLLSVFVLAVGCSTRKNKFVNRAYHNFTAYYNTLFHGKEALKAELKSQKESHRDNFQEGYIEVFSQNSLIPSSEEEDIDANFFGDVISSPIQKNNIGNFQKAEEKALKAIEKHSMVFGGQQKNKEIFNAYLLLIESRIYQGKLSSALEAISQVYQTMPKDKRLPLAKIYEGLIYSKMKNNIRAEEIFYDLDKNYTLTKQQKAVMSVYQAENLLHSNRKKEAIDHLEKAFVLNKSRQTKSRIAYLRGQILAELGNMEEARESFVTAYKYSNDFELEVKAQIEIAKTFNNDKDYEEAKKYLENISKKGTYASRKNEFYYALGLLAAKTGKESEANEFFQKSIKEKMSDPHIRGLVYYEIGNSHFKKSDYIKAGAYYDSAVSVIEHAPTKDKIKELSTNIKNISKNYYLIKKNDSILALTKMSENELNDFFQKHINELKEKEEKIELAKRKEKKNKELEKYFSYDNSSDFKGFEDNFSSQKGNKFYFANEITVAKGSNEFRKIWQNRTLSDNWRYGEDNKLSGSLDDLENEALGRTPADARRFEVAFYTEKIPKEKKAILGLKKERDSASLELGRMYETYFQNTPLATKTLYDLVDNQPEKDIKLQALYLIFSMNHEKTPSQAERAKNIIIQEFPDTPYAIFVKNPRNTNFTESEEKVKKVYQEAYALYNEEKYKEAQNIVNQAVEKYPKDALIPKFELLNAFIIGRSESKEKMISSLQQIVLNYERTNEGKKAKEILDFLVPSKKKEEKTTDTENKEIENKEQASEPEITENETDIIPTNESETSAKIEEIPQEKPKETPKEEQKKQKPKKLERPVQSWEKQYLD